MKNLSANIGHMSMAALIVVCVTVLAWHGTINGSEALSIIGVLGGVSVGGGVASTLGGALVSGSAAGSQPTGTPTPVSTPSAAASVTPSPTPTPVSPGGSL